MPGLPLSQPHAIDIRFLFSGWHGGQLGVDSRDLNAPETTLSDQLVAAWTNFARNCNPNGSGNSPWPRFTASSANFLSENIPLSRSTGAQFSANHQYDFWNTLLLY
jgi:para-nitrobenzyl esterase